MLSSLSLYALFSNCSSSGSILRTCFRVLRLPSSRTFAASRRLASRPERSAMPDAAEMYISALYGAQGRPIRILCGSSKSSQLWRSLSESNNRNEHKYSAHVRTWHLVVGPDVFLRIRIFHHVALKSSSENIRPAHIHTWRILIWWLTFIVKPGKRKTSLSLLTWQMML